MQFTFEFHDQDIELINAQLYLDDLLSNCTAGVSGEHEGVGGLKESSGQVVGGIGGFSGPSGKKEAGIGGKGEELHDQHVGRVWRFEEGGDRNGGSGLDSSAESLGTEGVCRNGHGGIDEVEDCRNLLGDCRAEFAEGNCVGVGGLGSRESLTNILLKLVRDKRRIMSSLHFQSCPLMIAQIVEQLCQIVHDVRGHLCKKDHVRADHRKQVRFQDHINQCNNNHNQEDNKDDGYNDVGVGYCCCYRFEIEGLTFVLSQTTLQLRQ